MEQTQNKNAAQPRFVDRDLSWLSFNERVLMEAEKPNIPILERLKFLAIYSSNLDEFYRVRIPSIMALNKLNDFTNELLDQIEAIVGDHQARYGQALVYSIIPALKRNGIEFLYNEDIPTDIRRQISDIFFNKVAGCLHVARVTGGGRFFPENNKIFFAVTLKDSDDLFAVNIPSDSLRRFHTVSTAGQTYIVMIDDIIRQHLPAMFPTDEIRDVYAFKITRDAELNLKDEVAGSLTDRIEKLLAKRDHGLATRLLYDAAMPEVVLKKLVKTLKLKHATKVAGGRYHNLKDFFSFPLPDPKFTYAEQKPVTVDVGDGSIFAHIDRGDLMLHTPYHNYDMILRFFNESVIDPSVDKIYVTLYRIAVDSAIARALVTAARNGKKVTVIVELKARFDEANNIRWAKKMKAAGVRICYSSPDMKVHAKMALVKRKSGDKKAKYYGLFSTGNFNETTARLYTDHVLLTANKKVLREAESLFKFLAKGTKSSALKDTDFTHLIVAPINIKERFSALIDREIANAMHGKRAAVTIKLNNLEEETLIDKLYEASSAGVKIDLIVRSICRLVPETDGLSKNIRVKRIVDRYLEHGRIFIFHNDGNEEVYCGSADWMNRNVYHRVEVCFPIYDDNIKKQLKGIIALQCADTAQAVKLHLAGRPEISQEEEVCVLQNVPLTPSRKRKVRSQEEIYNLVARSIDS